MSYLSPGAAAQRVILPRAKPVGLRLPVATLRAAALVVLLALPLGAAAQQQNPATTPAAPANGPAGCPQCVAVPYAGRNWAIDPAKGPFQGVVLSKTIDADGTHLAGFVVIHDDGGWRVAGPFVDDRPNDALKDANYLAELIPVVDGQ